MECKQKAEGRMWPWAGETPVRTAAERNIQKAKGRYERGMVKGQIDRTSLKFSRPEISHLLSPAYRYFLTNTSPNHFRVHNLKFTESGECNNIRVVKRAVSEQMWVFLQTGTDARREFVTEVDACAYLGCNSTDLRNVIKEDAEVRFLPRQPRCCQSHC